MLGIDTNLLLYSLNPDSAFHRASREFLSDVLANDHVVLSDLVLVELYLHLRNPAVTKRPLTAPAAAKLARSFLDFPRVTRAESAPVMEDTWRHAAKSGFARRRIIDVRLALTLQHHGATRLATANVKDFRNLGFEEVWNPVA
jgi:toxin-antitoxin system PIN domain toxin